jgi:pilus assembly protein Flp/PilA
MSDASNDAITVRLGKEPLRMSVLARFVKDESGATAIEYGLIAALIAVAIIAAATTLGGSLGSLFNRIGNKLNTATIS